MTSDPAQVQKDPPPQPPPPPSGSDPNIDHNAPSLDALAGLPSIDSSSIEFLLPPSLNFGDTTGSTSLDEQIQAFTAGLANTLGASNDAGHDASSSHPSASVAGTAGDALARAQTASDASDPLAEYLSAMPSMDATALATPHEGLDPEGHDANAAVESLLASLGQLSQQNHQSQQQGHFQPAPPSTHQALPENPPAPSSATPSDALDPTSPGYIDALLAEASRSAFAAVQSAAAAAAGPSQQPAPPAAASSETSAEPVSKDLFPSAGDTDASINASLQQFMASLQAKVTSSLAEDTPEQSHQATPELPAPAPTPVPAPAPATATPAAASPISTPSKPKPKPKLPKPAKAAAPLRPVPVPPTKRILGKRKHREIGPVERRNRVERALTTYLRDIDPLVKPGLVTGPILSPNVGTTKMTTVRCTHASVAQKSYGSEKRFLNPPPIVHVIGPLRRYADWGPAVATSQSAPKHEAGPQSGDQFECGLSMLVKGETDELFSNEQIATLDRSFETKVKSLYVTPTGRSKSFRLQLNLLRSTSPESYAASLPPAKRLKLASSPSMPGTIPGNAVDSMAAVIAALQQGHPSPDKQNANDHLSRLPGGLSWVSFESAPVTIVSKSSKKTVKPRSSSAQISNGSMISLFNRINSQTARTKYAHTANDGRLTAQSQEWSAYRVTLVSRPPQADLAGAEEGSVTYGSTIILTDITSGASTDPLVVCKVDKGEVMLPQIDPPAEIGLAGSGMRSRRIPVNIDLRGGAFATDNGPVSMLAAQKKDGQSGAASGPAGANGKPSTTAANDASSTPSASGGAAAGAGTSSSGRSVGEDLNVYGPVGQLQKVALMRFVPRSETDRIYGDSEHLESDFTSPRSYLCAVPPERWKAKAPPEAVGQEPLATSYVNAHTNGLDSPMLVDDLAPFDHHSDGDGNSLTFVSPKTKVVAKEHGPGMKVVDEVDDTFAWSVIGVSRFEFSFFDTSATEASKDEGPSEVPIGPFPLITSMPTYDQHTHTLSFTVANFVVPRAVGGLLDLGAGGGGSGGSEAKVPLEVWIGPLGPCSCQHSPVAPPTTPNTPSAAAAAAAGEEGSEMLVSVKLPPVEKMLTLVQSSSSSSSATTTDRTTQPTAAGAAEVPAHFLLPLVFVKDSDGTAFHSGRHVVCEDLVQLMHAAGHEADAETLCQLGFGLGQIAGPPKVGAWSVRII
ncbi:uncharacterized protein PFL1_02466 [Pseudozyma flocculosa PF-1]|uniref:Uncharacterized protein n=2 Tax=Pseudozyma flocculosa TaxID=84751 RepID=A0A5C3EYA8_9BASI|nr:uncharacterized protein PFL1_02466 [Pseudozyma flocculosa PF-1]EPQ29793.1 hypothetical protein PFL1_02466 [Pseudozyma flocculosa PF-1]SPO37082.1 uncharacterized protein PSFLO_02554 [Pseudozyma flocculosa]